MEINTMITLILTFIGVLFLGAFKAYERINNPGNPDTWDKAKFGTFAVVVALIMLIEYVTSGVINFPADEVINAAVVFATPIAGLFGLALTAITAGRLVKNDVVVPIVNSVTSGTGKVETSTGWSMGYTVTPTYKFGKSPLTVEFAIYATQPQPDHAGIVTVDIDWADGSHQLVPLVKGEATVSHTFSFVKNDKYSGHTFFPVFRFNGNDGSVTMFNVDGKGVEIWVESL